MNPLFLLSGIGMMAIALGTVVYWKFQSKVATAFFLWGAVAWAVGVVLKGIAAIPQSSIIATTREILPRFFSEPVLWLYMGLLTGVFECGAVLAFTYFIKKLRHADWKEAVGFGAGFGAVEAFLVGLGSFLWILLLILFPEIQNRLPSEYKFLVAEPDSLLVIPAGILERVTAIFIHTFSSILIIYAVQSREWRWFLVSFFYKTTVDAIAGFVYITYGIENLTTLGIWVLEIVLLPFGIVGAWGLWVFQQRWRNMEFFYKGRNTENIGNFP